jgi:hypothetical protein
MTKLLSRIYRHARYTRVFVEISVPVGTFPPDEVFS